jgi:hypothetical protein
MGVGTWEERGEHRFSRGHRTKFAGDTTSLWRVGMVYNPLSDWTEVLIERESYVRRKRRYMVLYEEDPVSMVSWELRLSWWQDQQVCQSTPPISGNLLILIYQSRDLGNDSISFHGWPGLHYISPQPRSGLVAGTLDSAVATARFSMMIVYWRVVCHHSSPS